MRFGSAKGRGRFRTVEGRVPRFGRDVRLALLRVRSDAGPLEAPLRPVLGHRLSLSHAIVSFAMSEYLPGVAPYDAMDRLRTGTVVKLLNEYEMARPLPTIPAGALGRVLAAPPNPLTVTFDG